MTLREIAAFALDEAGYAFDSSPTSNYQLPSANSLADHDRRFHPHGFKEGESCNLRRELGMDDEHDTVVSWSLGRDTDGKPGGVTVAICDITDETTDAIVNAANRWMLGGGGVDGAIHRAAGPQLLEECKKYPPDENGWRVHTGDAKITGAGNLKAKYVIHTAGPDCREPGMGDEHDQDDALALSYKRSLEVAKENGCRSVAFPSISTGIFGFPVKRAAKVAAETITKFLAENPEMSVKMCIYDPVDSEGIAKEYTRAFQAAEKKEGRRSEVGGQTEEVSDEAPEVKNLRHLLRTNAITKKEFASSLAALAALGKVSKARIGMLKRQMFAEDAAPGVFAQALDEAVAEDADVDYGKRMSGTMAGQCETPLEDCKANNPMTCRYHGAKLIAQDIENKLRQMGLTGHVKVVLNGVSDEDGKKLLSAEVSITGTAKDKKTVTQAMRSFANLPGVEYVEDATWEGYHKKVYTGFDIDILDPNAKARWGAGEAAPQTEPPHGKPQQMMFNLSQPETSQQTEGGQQQVAQPQQSSQQPTKQEPAKPEPTKQEPAKPQPEEKEQTVLDRFNAMTLDRARTVLATVFGKVYDHKSDLIANLHINPRKHTFAECSKKDSESAIRYMAATLEDVKSRFPNSLLTKFNCEFTPALSSKVYGRVSGFEFFSGEKKRVVSWKMRSEKDHKRDDVNTANGEPYSLSASLPRDERDESTIHHEMAHVVFREGPVSLIYKFVRACSLADGEDSKWRDRVSEYASKNDSECHSECVALAMTKGYKNGTLPKEVEKYVFEDVLGVAPGSW